MTISEARKVLLDLPEKLERESERAISITLRGRPVLAVMPWEFYESLVVVSNREAKNRLGV